MRTVKLEIIMAAFWAFFTVSGYCQTGLKGHIWKLTALVDADGSRHQITNSDQYTIEFKDKGQAAIQADCNGCGAAYTSTKSGISITAGFCTKMACPPDSYDQEFLNALTASKSWVIKSSMLQLKNNNGVTILFFTNSASNGPDEGLYDNWTLESVHLANTQNPDVDGEYKLNFTADGSVAYNLDCNGCFGSFTATESSISLEPGMCTLMGCQSNPVEPYLYAALGTDANYLLLENEMYILFNDGKDTLIYTNGKITGIKQSGQYNTAQNASWKAEFKDDRIVVSFEKKIPEANLSINHVNGKLIASLSEVNTKSVSFNKPVSPGFYLVKLATPAFSEQRIMRVSAKP